MNFSEFVLKARNDVETLVNSGQELQHVINALDLLDAACTQHRTTIGELRDQINSLQARLEQVSDELEESKVMVNWADIEKLFRESLAAAFKESRS